MYNYLKRRDSVTGSGFSENKLYEIQSKDKALEIVEKYMPEQIKNATMYCFRARMNVIRAISKAGYEKKYHNELLECREYIIANFLTVKESIKSKERIEYKLFLYCPFLYKQIVKFII